MLKKPHGDPERTPTVQCGSFGAREVGIDQVCRKIERFLVARLFCNFELFVAFDLVGNFFGVASVHSYH